MDWTDKCGLMVKAAEDDDFLDLDLESQALFFHLVLHARGNSYTNDFSMGEVYAIARKIGFDDNDAQESVGALVRAGVLSISANLVYGSKDKSEVA